MTKRFVIFSSAGVIPEVFGYPLPTGEISQNEATDPKFSRVTPSGWLIEKFNTPLSRVTPTGWVSNSEPLFSAYECWDVGTWIGSWRSDAWSYPSAAGAYSLTGSAGSYAYTGVAANLLRGYLLTGNVGAYTYTGYAATLLRKYTLTASAGSYTYTGVAANLLRKYTLTASAGSYTYTGYAATLQKTGSYSLSGGVGSFTFSGVSANLKPLRHSYPASDNTFGDWEPSTGTDLYAMVDDGISPDTNDYIFTHEASTCSMRLGAVANPGTTSGIVLNYQARGDGTHDLVVRLKQGVTTVATRTHTDVPTDYTTYAMELTSGEAATITDFSALDVELEAA